MRRQASRLSTHLRASLALRLMLPLLLALIPLALLARHQIETNRERTVAQALVAMDTAASALANSERMVIDDAGAIVASLSELPSVRELGTACTETLQAVTDIDRRFANLGLIDARGNVVCSALPVPTDVTLGDRTYFIDAMRYNDLAWGSYQVGRITGEATVNAGFPIRDHRGRPVGVMFGAVRVGFLGEQLSMVDLPADAAALVVDHAGNLLVDTARPARVGDPAYRLSLSYLMTEPQRALRGLFDGEVLTSVRELTGGLVVVVLPRASVVAPAEREARTVLIVGVLVAAAGAAGALLLTWFGVARPISRVRTVVRDVAGGDLTRRLAPRSSAGTLNGLAWDIDEMTGALASTEAQLRRFAFEDQLTGLPNRQALLQRIRWWPSGALVYLRLDSIADVASMLGFEAADEVILSVGQRLKALAEEEDLVGRVADGSFALFFPSAASAPEALDRMSRVLGVLEPGLTIGDADIEVVAHAGAALCPDDSADPETLLRLAELAARGANRSDRGTMFDVSVDAQKAENLRLLSEMRTALLNDAFDVVYQPIVKLSDAPEVHFEALIRWTGADGVRRSPAEFIPLAERTGAIEHLDRWVLDRVGRQIQEWGREGFRPAVSVNLSAHSLLNEDLPAFVDGLIEAYEPGHRQLHLEITETAFIEGFEGPLRVCEALSARGLPIALDDFGMGYAPILYLRAFPVDSLKVDMAVIRDLGHDPAVTGVIRGIVQMADHFRISTVAEGVETPEIDAALRTLGVTDAQGYLYGRPMSPHEARAWARARRARIGA